MKGNGCDWLPLLLLLAAAAAALQSELRHATCDNEERFENQLMCAGKAFGCLVPYPDNCSLFLVCDCVYPTVKLCPGKLLWDNETQVCNYAQVTKCIYYTFTTPEPTTTPTSSRPEDNTTMTNLSWSTTEENWPTSSYDPPPAPPGINETFCRNFKDGSVHRYPYDCNAYINCTLGWPVLNYCAPDKVFNQHLLICDTPETAQCEPLPLPSTTTTIEPSTTTIEPTTTTPDDGQCGAPPFGIEDDFCWSLGNGFYVYPYDCSAYLSCRNGCTNLAYCIPDKLFNPLLHICDTPNSVQCTPEPYPTTTIETTQGSTVETSTTVIPSTTVATTTTTTTAPATLPPDVNENACRNYPDNTRLPYAGNCSQYLLCQDKEVILGQCTNGLLFNPDLGICDEASDVYCYGDRTTSSPSTTSTTAAPTTVTIPTTTTPGAAELCEDQEVGASFPYVEDCSKYILCLGGGAYYIAPCAGGYYDPKTQACGPNVSPTACKEKDTTTTPPTTVASTTTTEVVTPPPTTTTVKPEEPAGICGDMDGGEMIPYPRDCSKYIVCVSPIPVAFYCLEGFYFNAKRQQCVSWQESDCDQEISTTPGYTSAPLEPTICTNSSRDTFPYPENCQWFIRCVNDYIYMMDVCNCGEYYDPIRGNCGADVPHDACRWDYTSTTTPEPTTESTTAITRPPPQKGPCDDAVKGELVPYPNDCSKYIKCDGPIASAFGCKDGEEFSPELRKCMDASVANCSPGPTGPSSGTTPISTTTHPDASTTQAISTTESTPSTTEDISTTESAPSSTEEISTTRAISTTETSTTEITTTEAPSGICGGKVPGTLVPYPNNCGKYIVCKEPIPIGYDCPEGLEFSPKELKCMDPDKANCNGGPAPGSTTPIPPYSTETTEEPSTSTPTITDSTTTVIDTTTPLTTVTDSTSTITDSTPAITDSTTVSTTEEPCTSTPTITDSTTTDSTSTIIDTTTPLTTVTESTSTITDSTPTITESTTVSTTEEPSTSTPTITDSPTTDSSSTIIDTTTPLTTVTDSTSTITDSTSTITDSTTVSLTEEPCTSTPTITDSTTTESTTTTTSIHPDTPNICCGVPLGTILPYPNDCNRYVVCDYPIPYSVVCSEGTAFDPLDLMCTAEGVDYCI